MREFRILSNDEARSSMKRSTKRRDSVHRSQPRTRPPITTTDDSPWQAPLNHSTPDIAPKTLLPQLPLSLLNAAQNKPMVSPLVSTLLHSPTPISILVGGTQERRDVQRPPRQLRQLHEHHPKGGVPNNGGRRAVLETQGVLYSWKHGNTFSCLTTPAY